VGCILLPLRGWFCGCACRRCVLQCDGRGWRFALGWGRCFGLADRNVRATLCGGFAGEGARATPA
jgi:hypothetical protein